MASILTTAADLQTALAAGSYPDGGPVRVLDVRWRLDRPDGRPAFLAGHIPGARYADLDAQLAEHGDPGAGRHPLPSPERLQAAVRDWGIDAGDTVVVYDDVNNLSSARAWWVLRDAGIADVRVLDGALAAWIDAGFALEQGEPDAARPGSAVVSPGTLPVLDIDEVLDHARTGLLLDARAGERFRGEVEAIDPRAGHIPGAVSAPTTDNLDETGRFRRAQELRARFAALGAEPGGAVGVYCGSGVTAAHEAVALTVAGYEPVLYPGSWSQWSQHPDRPLATGA
ncbi:sulfurtransferase [Microbacterium imperiale]|uniref:Sulfurtransferase n=1 Tax=Microbacterium imperiale TaxID=33884 RepID=A0A9W6M1Y2_9MICO|nr:sulfurtransferase [Microbacterium imperiale]MBP2420308.1 thiosulfate/3-mercaptopyruvate sulfurtransferase [Microbacterium imperiale]MDS0197832.1 sulfurtransferase [Microbacterium imperiale]BFE40650.1 sulfurtransferase [Microbacterium imperiale]GLJ78376.1 sulfurtransferase [Microbacterium imperiale]